MKLDIPPTAVSTAHVLPAKPKDSSTGDAPRDATEPPPVIVRFANRDARNLVYFGWKVLNGSNMFVEEHLTPQRAKLMAMARALRRERKIKGCWTANCNLYVRLLTERSANFSTESALLELAEGER